MKVSSPSESGLYASSAFRLQFSSYDQMAEAISDVDLEAYILAREHRPWELKQSIIGRTLAQYGQDGSAFAAVGQLDPHREAYYLSGSSTVLRTCNGQEIESGQAFRWAAGAELAINTRRAGDWLAVMIDPAAISRAAEAITGVPPRPIPSASLATAPRVRVARFRALVLEAISAVGAASPAGLVPQATRRLEETLTWEAARLFAEGQPGRRLGRPRLDRARILFRVQALMEAYSSEPLYLSTLCTDLSVPERTLRHFFDEQFGAGPVKVLRCRRLCQVREALAGASSGTRVSSIAGRYGFWHMGQFAADYRKLFGLLPSETLHQKGRSDPRTPLRTRYLIGLPSPIPLPED